MWFTKAQRRELYFTQKLGIPNGTASVPPMLWVADRQSISIFALRTNRRPTKDTKLYYAPFL
ncbi:prokaryotic E2 ligase family D protein [Niabella defluvii]|nr:prokaryotic E2 ligase family D protein [Niabella sp. I65]